MQPGAVQLPGLTPVLRTRLRRVFRLLTMASPGAAAWLADELLVRPRAHRIEPNEREYLASAQARTLTGARGRVRLYEWPGLEPAVLIVHGWCSHTARQRLLIDALRAQGRRVVAFDAPAHGDSGGARLDLPALQAAIASANAACGGAGALIAHSYGALAAISWLALAAPSTTARVRAAVLIATPRDASFIPEQLGAALELAPQVMTRLRDRRRRRYRRDPSHLSSVGLARTLGVPVLVVHGAEDVVIPPAHSTQIAGALPLGQLQLLQGLDHAGPLRDAAAIAQMLAFLDSCLAD